MAIEIELKAHVDNIDELKYILGAKAEFMGAFEKEDTYWLPNGKPDSRHDCDGKDGGIHPISKLRLRREKREFPDGRVNFAAFATCKEKRVMDGIEENDEHEFEVHPVEEFEVFLRRMGFKPGAYKKKRGWVYRCAEICAELVMVEGLGWFIELEIILDAVNEREDPDSSSKESRKKLLDFLEELGISKESIEGRYYTEMLSTL